MADWVRETVCHVLIACPRTAVGALSTELRLPTANCHRPTHHGDARLAGGRPQLTSLRKGTRQYRPSPSSAAHVESHRQRYDFWHGPALGT